MAKVVKGGRRFSFTAIIVVGDGAGSVGVGMGRANEVPEAIHKGGVIAKRNMFKVAMNNTTIAHDYVAQFKSSKVVMHLLYSMHFLPIYYQGSSLKQPLS